MEVKIYSDQEVLANAIADEIILLVNRKPEAVLCMASGETPRLPCRMLVRKVKEQNIDLSRCTFIGLDEWIGIPPSNEGSCHYFFRHELFAPLSLRDDQTNLFDGMTSDPEEECRRMDSFIFEKGVIDLMIVGIGMNGHIGFNEPGVSFNNYSHVIDLDETTVTVGQKYFKSATPLKQGITLGLKHLQDAKKVLLIANGSKKSNVIRQTIEGEVSPQFPASIMQTQENGWLMIDNEAAAMIDRQKYQQLHAME
jgi:galactosamine-6-phosphate isomerase